MHGRIVTTQLDSKLLEGNPLGDPTRRAVHVYLPPSYDGDKRFPTVMVLPGYLSTNHSLLNYKPFGRTVVQQFDEQVSAGESPPAILIMPDCMTRWGGSQYIDSAATGPYQSYLVEEVIPHVDANYKTIASAEGRAVVGTSSGGFGALRLGMDRPGVFAAIGSHCGDADFEISLRPMFVNAAIAFEQAGGIASFAEKIVVKGPRASRDFDAIFLMAAGTAYGADLSLPAPHVALPFDVKTAALLPEVWASWCAHDPVERMDTRLDALRTLRTIYLDAGDVDEHGLQLAARRLAAKMSAHDLPVHHEEFPGGHRGTSHRYTVSLPFLIAKLSS